MFPAPLPELLFWLATLICAVAQIAVVRAALAGRTPGASPAPMARARELFWVLLPAMLLAVLLAWTWRSLPGRGLPGRVLPGGAVSNGTHVAPVAVPPETFTVKT